MSHVRWQRGYHWEELLADYAATYGGPPRPDEPWPLFLALINRSSCFDARARLRLLDSVSAAIGAVFGGSESQVDSARDKLVRDAYPSVDVAPLLTPNLAAQQQETTV